MSEIEKVDTEERQARINKRMRELANHKVSLEHANEVRESAQFPPVPEKTQAADEASYIHRNVTTLNDEEGRDQ